MSQAELILDMPPIRSEQLIPTSLPVLIAVPRIKVRPSARERRVAKPHLRITGRTARRVRRRLRREVRFASFALLALVPIASVCTLGWSNRPDRILACSIPDPQQITPDSHALADIARIGVEYQSPQSTISSPGAVALSVDPAVVVPGIGSEALVIVPGYVLPDDSREDSVHEGS
jgi:hypothetical protein